jgi:hypothetical protein
MRGVGAGRLLVGVCTLIAAGRDDVPILRTSPPHTTTAARLLAVRDLVQGAALVLAPDHRSRRTARLANIVDGLHAASMLPLAVFSRRYRTPAVLSGATALTWVAVTSAASRSDGPL